MKAILEIKSCKGCTHAKITGVSSTDGWDRGEEYTCTKANKIIDPFAEWHDKVPIPEWCPIGVKE